MQRTPNRSGQAPVASGDADEATIAAAWQQLTQTPPSPALAAARGHTLSALYQRFASAYRDLLGLSQARRRTLLRRLGMSLAGAALAFALASGQIPAVRAAGIVVGGSCTLVDAITAANTDTATGGCTAGSGADTITLSGDVTLTAANNTTAQGANGLPVITSPITIEGQGSTITRDPAAPNFRILQVDAGGGLTLNQTTVSGGVSTNFSTGGIFAYGSLTLDSSTVSGNSHYGVVANGLTSITKSTISGNQLGGVIASSQLTLSNSTISGNGNSSNGRNGLMVSGYFNNASATVINSTISGNGTNGLGLETDRIGQGSATVTLSNTLIAGNTTNEIANSGGTITANAHNLIGYGGSARSTGFTPSGSDIVPSQALSAILDSTLRDNGGDTQTHALVSGSPALDAAPAGPATDQRGVGRPQGSAFDIGAFERAPVVPTNTPTNTPTATNTPTSTPTSTPTNTPTNTPTATNTPTSTPTIEPTATPPVLGRRLYLPVLLKQ